MALSPRAQEFLKRRGYTDISRLTDSPEEELKGLSPRAQEFVKRKRASTKERPSLLEPDLSGLSERAREFVLRKQKEPLPLVLGRPKDRKEEEIGWFDKVKNWISPRPSRPVRNNNPGNLKVGSLLHDPMAVKDKYGNPRTDDQGHLIFPNPQVGWMSAYADLTAKMTGNTANDLLFKKAGKNVTIADLNQAYATDTNWKNGVADIYERLTGEEVDTRKTDVATLDRDALQLAVLTQEGFILPKDKNGNLLDASVYSSLREAETEKGMVRRFLEDKTAQKFIEKAKGEFTPLLKPFEPPSIDPEDIRLNALDKAIDFLSPAPLTPEEAKAAKIPKSLYKLNRYVTQGLRSVFGWLYSQIGNTANRALIMGLEQIPKKPDWKDWLFLSPSVASKLSGHKRTDLEKEMSEWAKENIQENLAKIKKLKLIPDKNADAVEKWIHDIGSGYASAIVSLGLTAITKNYSIAAGLFGTIQGTSLYYEGRKVGKTPEEMTGPAVASLLTEAILESIGNRFFFKFVSANKPVSVGVKVLTEEIQEISQEIGANFWERFSYNDQRNLLDNIWRTIIVTALVAAPTSVAFTMLERQGVYKDLIEKGDYTPEQAEKFITQIITEGKRGINTTLKKEIKNLQKKLVSEKFAKKYQKDIERMLKLNIYDREIYLNWEQKFHEEVRKGIRKQRGRGVGEIITPLEERKKEALKVPKNLSSILSKIKEMKTKKEFVKEAKKSVPVKEAAKVLAKKLGFEQIRVSRKGKKAQIVETETGKGLTTLLSPKTTTKIAKILQGLQEVKVESLEEFYDKAKQVTEAKVIEARPEVKIPEEPSFEIIHYSPESDLTQVFPQFMGVSMQAGEEMLTQFEEDALKKGKLLKTNWYVAEEPGLIEAHRFGTQFVYRTYIPKAKIWDINVRKGKLPSDKALRARGFLGYKIDNQIRLFTPITVVQIGKSAAKKTDRVTTENFLQFIPLEKARKKVKLKKAKKKVTRRKRKKKIKKKVEEKKKAVAKKPTKKKKVVKKKPTKKKAPKKKPKKPLTQEEMEKKIEKDFKKELKEDYISEEDYLEGESAIRNAENTPIWERAMKDLDEDVEDDLRLYQKKVSAQNIKDPTYGIEVIKSYEKRLGVKVDKVLTDIIFTGRSHLGIKEQAYEVTVPGEGKIMFADRIQDMTPHHAIAHLLWDKYNFERIPAFKHLNRDAIINDITGGEKMSAYEISEKLAQGYEQFVRNQQQAKPKFHKIKGNAIKRFFLTLWRNIKKILRFREHLNEIQGFYDALYNPKVRAQKAIDMVSKNVGTVEFQKAPFVGDERAKGKVSMTTKQNKKLAVLRNKNPKRYKKALKEVLHKESRKGITAKEASALISALTKRVKKFVAKKKPVQEKALALARTIRPRGRKLTEEERRKNNHRFLNIWNSVKDKTTWFISSHKSITFLTEDLDGVENGPAYNEFGAPRDVSSETFVNWFWGTQRKWKKFLKEEKINEYKLLTEQDKDGWYRSERIEFYLASFDKDKLFAILHDGIEREGDKFTVTQEQYDKVMKTLTSTEKKVGRWLRANFYGIIYDAVNKVYKERTGKDLDKLKGYSRILRAYKDINMEKDPDALFEEFDWRKRVARIRKGFTKERLKEMPAGRPVKANSILNFYHNLKEVSWYIAYDKNFREWSGIVKDERFKEAVEARKGKSFYKVFKAEVLSLGQISSSLADFGILEKGVEVLTQNAMISMVGLNITSGLVQIGSISNLIGELGPKGMPYLLQAYAEFSKNPKETYKKVGELFPKVKYRFIEPVMQRALMQIRKGWKGRARNVINKSSFIFWKVGDTLAVRPGMLGAYYYGLHKYKGDAKEAKKYAMRVMHKSQPEADISDVPLVLKAGNRSTKVWMRMFTIFRNFITKNFAQMAHMLDVKRTYRNMPGLTSGSKKAQVAGRLMWRYLFTAMIPPLIYSFIKHGGIPEDEERRKEIMYMVSLYPFYASMGIGHLISASFVYKWGISTPTLAGVEELTRVFQREKLSEKGKAALNAMFIMYGIPWTQPRRTIQGMAYLLEAGEPDTLSWEDIKKLRRLIWSEYMIGKKDIKKIIPVPGKGGFKKGFKGGFKKGF